MVGNVGCTKGPKHEDVLFKPLLSVKISLTRTGSL